MKEIKVENSDVVDTTENTVEEVVSIEEANSSANTEVKSDKILVPEFTNEYLHEKNFIELERLRKSNLRNKDTLDNMKTTVESMAKFYTDNKDLLDASKEYGIKIKEEAEESEETDFLN